MKKVHTLFLLLLAVSVLLAGCGASGEESDGIQSSFQTETETALVEVTPSNQMIELEKGLSAVLHEGEDGFAQFLAQGGASTDAQVAEFLTSNLSVGLDGITFKTQSFGCSSLSAVSPEGENLFGRNFDWYSCDALIVTNKPENGYNSISTVNMDFLGSVGGILKLLLDSATTLAALYAPLDGMNDQGMCVAVLMIQDSDTIDQQTDKPDITTTTAVRLLLNRAATVEEAVNLLGQYDMHSSMGWMVHFALSDRTGRSVVVEYVDNEMVVTETKVVTNFYLSAGQKNGIGTAQSHTRYETLLTQLEQTPQMSMEQIRDSLDGVSKHNFNDGETTEWSTVYNQNTGEVHYYHRENYTNGYQFQLTEE